MFAQIGLHATHLTHSAACSGLLYLSFGPYACQRYLHHDTYLRSAHKKKLLCLEGKSQAQKANMRALSTFAEWLRKPGSRDFKKESKTNFAPI